MRQLFAILSLLLLSSALIAQSHAEKWQEFVNSEDVDNYESAQQFIDKFCENSLSDSLNAEVHYVRAAVARSLGEVEKSEAFSDVSILLAKKIGLSSLVCKAQIQKARLMLNQANYRSAVRLLVEALKVSKQISDRTYEATCHNYLGMAYDYQGVYNEALGHYRQAASIYKEENNIEGLSQSWNNMGVVFDLQKMSDSAVYYYGSSLVLDKRRGDSIGVAGSYLNLGLIELERENLQLAEDYFLRAEGIYDESMDIDGLSAAYTNLSELYLRLGDLSKMLDYNRKSMEIAEMLGDQQQLLDNYEVLIRAYKNEGAYEQAFQMSEKRYRLKDSIFNKSLTTEINALKEQYESEQAKLELEKQKKINESQQEELFWRDVTMYGVSTAGIVLLIMGFFLLRNNRRISQINSQLVESQQELRHQQEQIEAQNKDIKASIMYASDIQSAILPTDDRLNAVIGNHLLLYMPKDIVSGDFYWVQEWNGSKLIAVADCTGHGVPGAFMSIMCSNVLNHVVREKNITDPGTLLTEVNIELRDRLKSDQLSTRDGMDLTILCVYGDKVEFSGAMNSIYTVTTEGVIQHKGESESIGGTTPNEFKFETHELNVNPGDSIFLTSDGFQDQFGGPNGKKFMRRRLKELMAEAHRLPENQWEKVFVDAFHEWRGAHEQVDDICLMGWRV